MEGGGEDDGAEDPAAGGAQHQLRTPSSVTASPGRARPRRGGLAGQRSGQPATWRRWRGGLASRRPRILAHRSLGSVLRLRFVAQRPGTSGRSWGKWTCESRRFLGSFWSGLQSSVQEALRNQLRSLRFLGETSEISRAQLADVLRLSMLLPSDDKLFMTFDIDGDEKIRRDNFMMFIRRFPFLIVFFAALINGEVYVEIV